MWEWWSISSRPSTWTNSKSLISLDKVLVIWDGLDSEATVAGDFYNPADFARLLKIELHLLLQTALLLVTKPCIYPYKCLWIKRLAVLAFEPARFSHTDGVTKSCLLLFRNAQSPFKPVGIQAVMLVLKAFLKTWWYISVQFTCSLIYFLWFQCNILHTKCSFSWLTLKCLTALCEFFFIFLILHPF